MLETPAKDPFSMPWWSESFESSPRRQSSVARINCDLSRLKVQSDGSESSEIDIASKKLTWISREDYNSPRRNFVDRTSIQNGCVYGRSTRHGAVLESPGRGIQIPPESPARRGESVRRLRTPSMDFDMTKAPSSASPTRRLRSVGSPKHGSAIPKSEHTLIREASAIRRVLAARDQRNSSKSTVQAATKESPGMISTGNSRESDPMVVSYLAEETDRIIKGRIQKLKLQSQSNANANVADQQLQVDDHERSSAREVRSANGGKHRRHSSHSFIPQVDITTAERVGKSNMQRDHRAGELDHESYIHASRPGSTSSPGSPLPPVQYNAPASNGDGVGPTRTISATMENYLENRKKGSTMGPQIVVSGRPGSTVSTAASHSNLAVLREENQLDNPSTSRRNGGSRRHDSFTESRAALSPLNGNEEVTHSTTTLSQRKEEYSTGGLGEEAINEGRNDSKESVQMEGENGFPSRLQYWAEFLGEDEMDSTEGLRYLTQESEERISPSGRKELGTKIAPVRLHSNGGRVQSPQARTQIDGHIRHPAARGHSQRYEEVGRSLLPDKKLSSGSSGDKHNSSRRSQSCRRDPIINSLLDFSQEDEGLATRNLASLSSGLDDSSNAKSSRRFSVEKNLSSTDVFAEEAPSVEVLIKTKSDVKESSERKHARRLSVSIIDSAGNSSPNCGGNSASVPAPQRKPKSSFSAPLQGPFPNPELINESNHPRTRMSSQTKTAALDSQLSEKQKDGAQVDQPKRSHRSSQSLDHDTLKKLFVKTKDNRRGPSVTASPSVPQTGKMNSPKTTAKPQPASPGTSFQRWLANQFKIGSKSKPSSTGNDRQLPEEEKPRKKSPWRRKPVELFQGITRRRGSSTPRCTSLPLFEANGLSKSPQVNSFEVDSSSHSESFTISPVPWHHRVTYAEPGSASPYGNAYVLPSIATLSPAYTNGSPSLPTNRRPS